MLGLAREKIKSSKGASLIFALVGFVMAAMVSTVIVSAAAGNANRAGSMREGEQAYLSVTSAASVVTAAMKDFKISYSIDSEGTITADSPTYTAGPAQVIQKAAEKLALDWAAGAGDSTVTMAISVGDKADDAEIIMDLDSSGNIRARVIHAWTDRADITAVLGNNYYIQLVFTQNRKTKISHDSNGNAIQRIIVSWPESQSYATK
ncbi:MAG: hypothetical protein K5989_07280 [Lachnospiraceae bacterium]|nr:hypothetical protein [Lachnospiraceae bacterium]